MTASRTWRSRSVRDVAMLPNLLAANNLHGRPGVGQVAHQRIEAEPAFRSAREAPIRDLHPASRRPGGNGRRSEEHTSELQSRGHLVCRLLLEKKKMGRPTW